MPEQKRESLHKQEKGLFPFDYLILINELSICLIWLWRGERCKACYKQNSSRVARLCEYNTHTHMRYVLGNKIGMCVSLYAIRFIPYLPYHTLIFVVMWWEMRFNCNAIVMGRIWFSVILCMGIWHRDTTEVFEGFKERLYAEALCRFATTVSDVQVRIYLSLLYFVYLWVLFLVWQSGT